MARIVRRIDVPPEIRARYAAADYASAFLLPGDRSGKPEKWARATFEGAPVPLRWLLPFGWRLVLGLRLGPLRSSRHVLGWRIEDSDEGSITLESRSWLAVADNIVVVEETGVRWVTVVHYRRRVAAAVWALAAPIHHLTVPWLLGRAARSLDG